IETLFNVNLELYKNYEYVPGSTTNATTPFEVMRSKRGVCQDFAQLFVCIARLLGIPARYVCGYIFTGNTGMERAQSDASHAWVELYLPKVGWRAFDPTNGVLPSTGHVRVAYGRFYRDATPTDGTLYGDAEQTALDIEVTVEDA
ncbi:MAG: transglutaminase family protein, partial [Planctomycetota bacterium]